ncbi:hemerythrin domain-containing protein [Caldovatus aquaticus]|uniref:Hemerythrin domain-containing protein n=1 Tax=Caldovatus aquaticus TaxID=2865671 RepID=A0ABS7EZQ7_9PROT|nr:hemerythrin domain-containing protein [Caldovatus aquaticus]MBW8268865.1 hemerythrin domain-containing protein [Caldovatus aquaticus]
MPPGEPSPPVSGAHVAPIQPALLDDPIAFLSAEHARQTVLLGHLERVARDPQGRAARDLAAVLLVWLTEEMPLHVADEERSLYPRLAAHDEQGVLERLREEHRRDHRLIADLVSGLRRIAEGHAPMAGFPEIAREFAAGHRRHLAIEESVLAPLARRCLGPEAMAALGAEMAARRDGRRV